MSAPVDSIQEPFAPLSQDLSEAEVLKMKNTELQRQLIQVQRAYLQLQNQMAVLQMEKLDVLEKTLGE
ncbi:hypothetical protein EJP67_18645 [Variovorax guangxiensis]|uniref:Uncharacterized protein n=1 Tax=Variovorax guangxiensis TaxID=1775474 RepID=A0A3S0XGW6_9BURK|nr:hypothetical protein [Variovorax guangxiensis]RUR69080.1 hypothetical protein EJP67_18645 [Variovorax guangxiensis]